MMGVCTLCSGCSQVVSVESDILEAPKLHLVMPPEFTDAL